MERPEWMRYNNSERVYVEELDAAPLLPNHPGTCDSRDLEPQKLVPLYLEFETGRVFYFAREAKDLGAS